MFKSSNNNLKVSIVVPVYNVEKYIEKCLKTLINQTIDNYEIIIVVDGSTDGSINIVKQYYKKNPNIIKYYETENRGLSAARNYGIEKAKGEYIGFVDSDDFVDETMYEKMYNYAISNNSDIVVCAYNKVTNGKSKKINMEINSKTSKKDKIIKAKPYAWNKLYKKDLFEKFNVKFPEGLIFEDISTVYPLLIQTRKVVFLSDALYFYTCDREDSITKKKKRDDLCILKTLFLLNDYCIKNNIFDKYKDLLCEINVRHVYYRLRNLKNSNNKKYNLKFVFKSFNMLNEKFPNWRKKSEYAKKIKKSSRFMIFWQIKVLLGR